MKEFTVRYNGEDNREFIDKMLKYSYAHPEERIGYPDGKTINLLEEEITSYDIKFKNF